MTTTLWKKRTIQTNHIYVRYTELTEEEEEEKEEEIDQTSTPHHRVETRSNGYVIAVGRPGPAYARHEVFCIESTYMRNKMSTLSLFTVCETIAYPRLLVQNVKRAESHALLVHRIHRGVRSRLM